MINRDWQPIETAPKDGTEILVCRVTIWADDDVEYVCGVARWAQWHEGDEFEWRVTQEFGGSFGEATNWMPLPDPPRRGPENGDSTAPNSQPEAND